MRSLCSIGPWMVSAGSFVSSIFSKPATPEDWLRYHRHLRDLGTKAVIVGVIAESLIDEFWEIERPPLLRGIKSTTLLRTKAEQLKRLAMIFVGVVMIGGGIGLEMWQGGKADDVSDQIRTRLQEQLVFARAKAGARFLDIPGFLAALKGKPMGHAELWYKRNDAEAFSFASQIHRELGTEKYGAGWDVGEPVPIPSTGGDPRVPPDAPDEVRYGGGMMGADIILRAPESDMTDAALTSQKGAFAALQQALVEGRGNRVGGGSGLFSIGDPSLAKDHFIIIVGEKQ
jgi:hypothetical protein